MSSIFPCPNTGCTYQFNADQLPPAAMVTCPFCRTKFPYRRGIGVVMAQPVAVPPPASSTQASHLPPSAAGEFDFGNFNQPEPTTSVSASEPDSTGRAPQGSYQREPRLVGAVGLPSKKTLPVTALVLSGVVAFLVVAVVGVVIFFIKSGKPAKGPDKQSEEIYNLEFIPFSDEWQKDESFRREIDANVIGMSRKESPKAMFALWANDYKDRMPRANELRDAMTSRVKSYMPGCEIVNKKDGKLLGLGAQAIAFQGTPTTKGGDVYRGEAYAVGSKGIGYVVFLLAPLAEWDAAKKELDSVKDLVKLGKGRENWKESSAPKKSIAPPGAPYDIEDHHGGVWKSIDGPLNEDRMPDLKAYDPATVYLLEGRKAFQGTSVKGTKSWTNVKATAAVLELPKSGDDILETVKTYTEGYIKRQYVEGDNDGKIVPYDSPTGLELPTGPKIGRFIHRDKTNPDLQEMWILSAIEIDGKIYAVQAKCREEHARYLEEWMTTLAGSLKPR
ncbi:MAG: zinc-ribbon domain-containing protein [Gemmataceae bacterium]|nr:zinc-ribbon domain-containing protein [Gemmataceae bacterium]